MVTALLILLTVCNQVVITQIYKKKYRYRTRVDVRGGFSDRFLTAWELAFPQFSAQCRAYDVDTAYQLNKRTNGVTITAPPFFCVETTQYLFYTD